MLIVGPWVAFESWLFASCLIGGLVLFAFADLILPLAGPPKRKRLPGVRT